MSYVPVGNGQKLKLPLASAAACITMRSTPFASGCSNATKILPPLIGFCVEASTTCPLIAVVTVLTCPAVSVGFSRYCPLP